MADPPADAIQAAAEAINNAMPGALILDEAVAWRAAKHALEAAEQAWPHQPPTRDPASTTNAQLNIATTSRPNRRYGREPFGFGKDTTA